MEQKMTIEFSVEDYLEQLQLMDQQYGQEEDLYPWIYMLLQMAECKKRDRLGNLYKAVSIRDVHNAKAMSLSDRPLKCWKLRWELTKRVGPPDIAIIDKDGNTVLGCVEVKSIQDKLFTKDIEYLHNLSIGTPQELKYTLKYHQNMSFEIYSKVECDYMIQNNIDFEIVKHSFIIERKRIDCLENTTKDVLCNGSKMLQVVNGEDWKYDIKNLPAGEESNQLAGHLDKFKKVIYTNGYEFYYMELKNDYKIQMIKLLDLKNGNEDISLEWKGFLALLQAIDWHKESNIEDLKKIQEEYKRMKEKDGDN